MLSKQPMELRSVLLGWNLPNTLDLLQYISAQRWKFTVTVPSEGPPGQVPGTVQGKVLAYLDLSLEADETIGHFAA